MKYYGFNQSNDSDEPAWFHTHSAAVRFAESCGWNGFTVETTEDPEGGIMDTVRQAWCKNPAVLLHDMPDQEINDLSEAFKEAGYDESPKKVINDMNCWNWPLGWLMCHLSESVYLNASNSRAST